LPWPILKKGNDDAFKVLAGLINMQDTLVREASAAGPANAKRVVTENLKKVIAQCQNPSARGAAWQIVNTLIPYGALFIWLTLAVMHSLAVCWVAVTRDQAPPARS
jgi:hypothetical protein